MAFHICIQHHYWANIYLQLYSRGKLFYCLCGYIYLFAPDFTGILITNPPYILSVESYHVQIIIGLEYNL